MSNDNNVIASAVRQSPVDRLITDSRAHRSLASRDSNE